MTAQRIGRPGGADVAFSTASMERKRMALAIRSCLSREAMVSPFVGSRREVCGRHSRRGSGVNKSQRGTARGCGSRLWLSLQEIDEGAQRSRHVAATVVV